MKLKSGGGGARCQVAEISRYWQMASATGRESLIEQEWEERDLRILYVLQTSKLIRAVISFLLLAEPHVLEGAHSSSPSAPLYSEIGRRRKEEGGLTS